MNFRHQPRSLNGGWKEKYRDRAKIIASRIIEDPEKLRAGRRAGLAVVNEGIDAIGQGEKRTGNDGPVAEGQRDIGRPLNPILIIRRRAPPEHQIIGPGHVGDGDAGNGQRLG